MTPCDVAALKKCLEDHKGDGEKCKEHIAAFKSVCSASSPAQPQPQASQQRSSVAPRVSH